MDAQANGRVGRRGLSLNLRQSSPDACMYERRVDERGACLRDVSASRPDCST